MSLARVLPDRARGQFGRRFRQTRAVRDGDVYVLNGAKCFITNGGVASLYTFRQHRPGQGRPGVTAFLVPRDTPGILIGKVEDKMGQRASSTAEIFFEDVRVPAANILGRERHGFIIAMKTFDQTRAGPRSGRPPSAWPGRR